MDGNTSHEDFEALLRALEGGPPEPSLDLWRARDPAGYGRAEASVRAMLTALGEARLVALSPSARARALALLAQPARGAWRRVLARLVPPPVDPLPAMRAGAAAPFHRLYEVEGYDIDLAQSEDGRLIGQVLAAGPGPGMEGGQCVVQCREGEQAGEVWVLPIDATGSFVLPQSLPSKTTLVLERDGLQIVLEDVDLA